MTAARQIKELNVQVPLIAITHCEVGRIIERFGKATEGFALGIAFLSEMPDAQYVKNLLASYELSEQTVRWIKDRCLNVE